MDPLWLLCAFFFGFGAKQVGLPPLVGFLVAGFVLRIAGAESGLLLRELADTGITILLFSIGLKLRLRTLTRSEVWAGGLLHMALMVGIFAAILLALPKTGIPLLESVDSRSALLVAFALSFSSTVFAVKVLESRGESSALHGRVAVGILIVQDIVAVIFLSLSEGVLPSPWALLLLAVLFASRPLLFPIFDRIGHGEMVLLFGLTVALGVGFAGFQLVSLKGSLGALVVGVLLSSHPKSGELAHSLLSLKDLLLIGFFLDIGLSGDLTWTAIALALLILILLPIKSTFFLLLLTRFRLRGRTAFLATLALSNYSEFGLIVSAIAVRQGWMSHEWMIGLAIALSLSFILGAPVNTAPHTLYARLSEMLHRLETRDRHPDDALIDPGDVDVIIFGMGRVGTGAFDEVKERYPGPIVGVDFDDTVVNLHQKAGRHVIHGDATDADFWDRIGLDTRCGLKLVILTLPTHSENLRALARLKDCPYRGPIVAAARYRDQVNELKRAGATAAFDLLARAGSGLAEQACEQFTLSTAPGSDARA